MKPYQQIKMRVFYIAMGKTALSMVSKEALRKFSDEITQYVLNDFIEKSGRTLAIINICSRIAKYDYCWETIFYAYHTSAWPKSSEQGV